MGDIRKARNFSLAFVVGAAVGSGVTWLLTPRPALPSPPSVLIAPPPPPKPALDACAELRLSIEDLVGEIADSLETGLSHGIAWADRNLAPLHRVV